MLVQLSPWSTTLNASSSSKKGKTGVSIVASSSSIVTSNPKSKSSSVQKRKRNHIYQKKSSAIVLTSPHSISCFSCPNNQSPTEMKKQWTVSSRPGVTHAFLPTKGKTTSSLKEIPCIYDSREGRLYTATNKNTSIQIYSNDEKKNVPEQIFKTIPLPKVSSSHLQSLQLYDPIGSSPDKNLSLQSSSIVVGCTNDARIIVLNKAGDLHELVEAPSSLFKKKSSKKKQELKDGTLLVQKETLQHLWTGMTHSNKESNVMYTVTSVWMDMDSNCEHILVRHVSFSTNDEHLAIHSEAQKVLNFRNHIMNQVDMSSIQVCSLSHDAFVFIFQSSSRNESLDKKNQETKKYWFCCYCQIDSSQIDQIGLKPNRPFVLLPDQQTLHTLSALKFCALTPNIVAFLWKTISSDFFSEISLIDVSRDGILLSNTTSNDLPLLNNAILGMVSDQSLNQLFIYTKDKIVASSIKLSSSHLEEPVSKKNRATQNIEPNLANLMASSFSTWSLKKGSIPPTVCIPDEEIEHHVTMETAILNYIHELNRAENPLAFEEIFTKSIQEICTPVKESVSDALPPSYIEKICQLCIDILESCVKNELTDEYDPIIRTLLYLIDLDSNVACKSIFDHVDSNVEDITSLVVLYKLLSCGPSRTGGAVTEVLRVDAWRYLLLKPSIEQIIGFYSFCMREEETKKTFVQRNSNIDNAVKEWVEFHIKLLELNKEHDMKDDESKENKRIAFRSMKRLGKIILSNFILDFSDLIIVQQNNACNNALLRSAFYHQEIKSEDEIDLEIWVLTSLMKKHGSVSLNGTAEFKDCDSIKKKSSDKHYYSRQGIENVIQWINAILDVHGSILVRSNFNDSKSCIFQLYNVVFNELNASRNICDLQACLMVVVDSLQRKRIDSSGTNDENGSNIHKKYSSGPNSNDGALIVPGYGVERLTL